MSEGMSSENEMKFVEWFEAENHRRELAHLESLRARYEWLIILCCLMTAAWSVGLFAAYQLGRLAPDIAGVTTAAVMSGGVFLLWRLHGLRREVMRRLRAQRGMKPPSAPAASGG